MANAAAIKTTSTAADRLSLSSLRSVSFSLFQLSRSSFQQRSTVKPIVIGTEQKPGFQLFSSTGIQAAEKSSPTSFLDRKQSRILHFVKYQGLGNDFIVVDNRESLEPKISPGQAVRLCNRTFGIGADGVI